MDNMKNAQAKSLILNLYTIITRPVILTGAIIISFIFTQILVGHFANKEIIETVLDYSATGTLAESFNFVVISFLGFIIQILIIWTITMMIYNLGETLVDFIEKQIIGEHVDNVFGDKNRAGGVEQGFGGAKQKALLFKNIVN
jgi:hypothetical protein